MNIEKIMKELIETLAFSKTHSFSTINLDVVAINEAQIRINKLAKIQGFDKNGLTIIAEMLSEAMEKNIIKDYDINGSTIEIVPMNEERMRKYLGGRHHYSLTLTFSDDILA